MLYYKLAQPSRGIRPGGGGHELYSQLPRRPCLIVQKKKKVFKLLQKPSEDTAASETRITTQVGEVVDWYADFSPTACARRSLPRRA